MFIRAINTIIINRIIVSRWCIGVGGALRRFAKAFARLVTSVPSQRALYGVLRGRITRWLVWWKHRCISISLQPFSSPSLTIPPREPIYIIQATGKDPEFPDSSGVCRSYDKSAVNCIPLHNPQPSHPDYYLYLPGPASWV